MKLKNVTVTLQEDVALWARVRAAKENTSVSRLLGNMLKGMMQQDARYERAMKEYLSTPSASLKRSGKYPGREELHARGRVR